jgi:hypothetical protein
MKASRLLWLLAPVCLLLAPLPASAGSIAELYRSTPGASHPRSVSVDPGDGSVWVADFEGNALTHLAADGAELLRKNVTGAVGVSVDAADGSVWVVGWGSGTVLHLSCDGTELWRDVGFYGLLAASADSADGTAWLGGWSYGKGLVHLSAAGEEIGRYVLPSDTIALPSTNPLDGSCWASVIPATTEAVHTSPIMHVASDGTLLWRKDDMPRPGSISVNPRDGSCWTCGRDGADSTVIHFAADGTQLWRRDGWWSPDGGPWLATNAKDGSCWVVHNLPAPNPPVGIILVASDGAERARATLDDGWIAELASDPADGSLWLAFEEVGLLVHLKASPDCTPFWDLSCDHWAADEITACAEAGIVAGFPDGNYRPALPVTRDAMAVYVARALAGGDTQVPTGPETASFTDVGTDHWAYQYIEYVASGEANVVQGYPGGNYRPDQVVNRGQMAVYIARAMVSPAGDAALPTPPSAPTFADVAAEGDWSWCYPQVEYLSAEGIVQGYWDGYRPAADVTRDQMAVYVARAFHLPMRGSRR